MSRRPGNEMVVDCAMFAAGHPLGRFGQGDARFSVKWEFFLGGYMSLASGWMLRAFKRIWCILCI